MTLPSVLLVSGPAGFGKSFRARQLAVQDEAVVVACRGLPQARYTAVREIISALGGGCGAIVSDYDACWQVRALLTRPLVLDDVDCADLPSQRVLQCVVAGLPVGGRLVMTYTTGNLPWAARLAHAAVEVTRLELRPLSLAEVGELPGAGQAETFRAAEIWELTGGVPLFAEAVLSSGDRLAPVVREWVAAGLGALSPSARRVVETLALLRKPAPVALLAQTCASKTAAVVSALDEAMRAGLVTEYPDETFACAPPVVGHAIAAGLSPARRREVHTRIATAMRARDDDELLHHARASDDYQLLVLAAEQVARTRRVNGDTAGAAALLRNLLSEPDLPAAMRIAVAGRACRLVVSGLECRETMALLRGILDDETLPIGLRGELRMELGLLMLNQAGDPDGGREELARAASELRHRPVKASRAMSNLGLPLWGSCHADEHRRWLQESERLLPKRIDPAIRLAATGNVLFAQMLWGDPAVWSGVAAFAADAPTDAGRTHLMRSYTNFAGAAMALGYHARAAAYLTRARLLAGTVGAMFPHGVSACTRLRLAYAGGDWAGLPGRCHEHLADMTNPYLACSASLVLGMLATARGEFDEAQRFLDDPALRIEVGRLGPEETEAGAARMRLAFLTGHLDIARAEFGTAERAIRVKGMWTWAAPLIHAGVPVLIRTGEAERAEQLLADFAADMAVRDYPHGMAALPAGQAFLATERGQHEQAAQLFYSAAARYAELPRPYERAQALENAARCELAVSTTDSALGTLSDAIQLFSGLGATFDAARCAQLLREHGGAPPGLRPGRRGYGDQLSPREQEVARLVGAGLTNREIAHVLFLSPRTVEQHVASVLRKLGTTSRDQVRLKIA